MIFHRKLTQLLIGKVSLAFDFYLSRGVGRVCGLLSPLALARNPPPPNFKHAKRISCPSGSDKVPFPPSWCFITTKALRNDTNLFSSQDSDDLFAIMHAFHYRRGVVQIVTNDQFRDWDDPSRGRLPPLVLRWLSENRQKILVPSSLQFSNVFFASSSPRILFNSSLDLCLRFGLSFLTMAFPKSFPQTGILQKSPPRSAMRPLKPKQQEALKCLAMRLSPMQSLVAQKY